jgi:type II secretory pathway pseudopilin PulG
LLEAVVVLGLAAVLSATVAPSISVMMGGLELRAAAVQLASALVRARVAALGEGRPWRVRVSDSRSSFEVGPLDGPLVAESLPGNVRFSRATSGGEVLLAPTGWAENATFTLERSGREREVVLNQRGRVTLRAEVAEE